MGASDTLFKLGPLTFSLKTAVPDKLKHMNEYRWPKQDRLGRPPARQWVGIGDCTCEFEGVVYPSFEYAQGSCVGIDTIDAIRSLAEQGTPYQLTDGMGHDWGTWVIESIEETASSLLSNSAPRKQEFTMKLGWYGPDNFNNNGIIWAGGDFVSPRSSGSGSGLDTSEASSTIGATV